MTFLSSVLVTGHTGFIGKALTTTFDRLNRKWFGASTRNGLVLDDTWSLHTLPAAGTVVHLAARTHVPASWHNPDLFFKTNYLATLAALEYARKYSSRFIYISSYIYGSPKYLPIDETHPIVSQNPYAASKIAGEELCQFYADAFEVPITVLRPFNIYGPGQSTSNLVPHIIQQALLGAEVRVEDLEPKRDFLYIDDFIDGIIRVLDAPKSGFHVYNIGYGVSYSVKQVIEIVVSILKSNLPINCSQKTRPNEISDCVADYSKIMRDFGWKPQHSLRRGLKNVITNWDPSKPK